MKFGRGFPLPLLHHTPREETVKLAHVGKNPHAGKLVARREREIEIADKSTPNVFYVLLFSASDTVSSRIFTGKVLVHVIERSQ